MIDFLLTLGKIVVASLPCIILCLLGKKVNIERSERSKQVLMPFFALLYIIIAMLLMNKINEWLIALISNIPKWLSDLAGVSWMPESIGNAISNVGGFFESFLNSLNLKFWVFFIANFAIILVYLIVKRILIGICRKAVKTDGSLHRRVSEMFYEYFSERDKWCIKENFVQMRSLLKVFYYSAIVLSALLMYVSRWFYFNGLTKVVFYPVFGIIVIGELYFFLDGLTKKEYTENILGEDENAYKTVNYSLLRKFLRTLFKDKLLTENTSINSALSYGITTEEILRDLENSEDQSVVSFSVYYSALNSTGVSLDHNYIYSSLDLLKGKSILFNNPFYYDLIPYAFYPMNRALLSHKKVLVILGRHSVEDDITEWIKKGISAVTNIPYMWKIGVLSQITQELDIGIITRSNVLNLSLHNANSEFLSEVGFCVIIEPSKLISTAQIGLNLIVKQFSEESDVVYCMCDKNCDGLVDTMSHVLMTSLTEVSATNKHLGTSSYMCWETDSVYLHHRIVPNISRYLGTGTELSFAALKNQVTKTYWYGGDAFPVRDILWIARQYYYDLMKYANLPTSQKMVDECFNVTPNYWSAPVSKNNYITVEDEDFNMFEVLREFSTRSTEQGFINVISSDYLLNGYMADNASVFETDAKAIPYIVPDYARTKRNVIIKLILMMSTYPVKEEVLVKELSLISIKVFDIRKQLWYELYRSYADLSQISALSDDYMTAVEQTSHLSIERTQYTVNIDLIVFEERFNPKTGILDNTYSINNKSFLASCVAELKSAGYISEDEQGEKHYLGSELCGHIYQKYLPGQFFTFDGKYYEMLYLTADGQVLVRRAADHISERPVYRQIRIYEISDVAPSNQIGSQKDISGLKVTREYADIEVSTLGYYKMSKYGDFGSAKKVLFQGEDNGVPKRAYHNKEILKLELPQTDTPVSDNIRYTIVMLINEVMKTMFADNQAYICAVTDDSFLSEKSGDSVMTYAIRGCGYEISRECIYIIEDSQIDLGLTVAVERNLERIFGIIQDYLNWHMETLEKSLNPPITPQPSFVVDDTPIEKTSKTGGIKGRLSALGNGIKKLLNKIKGLFRRKPKKGKEEPSADEEVINPTEDKETPSPTESTTPPDDEDNDAVQDTDTEEGIAIEGAAETEQDIPDDLTDETITNDFPTSNSDDDNDHVKSTDDDSNELSQKETADLTQSNTDTESGSSVVGGVPTKEGFVVERKPYHEHFYLRFGMDEEPSYIDIAATREYLEKVSITDNTLKRTRESKKIAERNAAAFVPGKPDVRYCDFCGCEIFGVEFETLSDGRDRCMGCGRTAIKSGNEFRKIFEDVKRNMESFFGIKINSGIRVEMVNSDKLHRRLGKAFIPTPKSDGRVLGVAIKDKNGYTLMIENGSPRMASMLTMAHELTHIWQYLNWKDRDIKRKYGRKEMHLEVYEGMAKWVEIQYAYLINEPAVAKREEILTSYRDDEYGRGFLRYRANYPFSIGTVITKATPFLNIDEPLDLRYCGSFHIVPVSDGINDADYDAVNNDDNSQDASLPPTPPANHIKGINQRSTFDLRYYAYELLDENEKEAYCSVLDAVNSFASVVSDFAHPLTDVQAQKVVDYVQRDHPEIFWFQHGATLFFDSVSRQVCRIELQYCMTQDEKDKRQMEIDNAIKPFIPAVSDNMCDYEVALRIYENIIKLADYDEQSLNHNPKETVSSDVPDDLRSIYGVFVNKLAVCAGYSKATQYLLNMFGIECTYVTSDTHAWNVVNLEGDYYHMDTTWGDSIDSSSNSAKSNSAVNYDCFCLTTDEVLSLDSHTPTQDLPLPNCVATKCNYHHRQGLFFESYSFERIRKVICDSIRQGANDISLRFAGERAFDEAKKSLITNGKIREVIQLSNLSPDNRVSTTFSYTVSERRLTMAFFFTKP